jgi:hypothetical protein
MKIEITAEERDALVSALETYLSELGMEIADTDRADFREQLKSERELLQSILQKLGQADNG